MTNDERTIFGKNSACWTKTNGSKAKRAQEAGKSLRNHLRICNERFTGGGGCCWAWRLTSRPCLRGMRWGRSAAGQASAGLASQCHHVQRAPAVDIRTEALEGKPVVVVHVPESPRRTSLFTLRPRGCPGGAFRRIGSTDQRCNRRRSGNVVPIAATGTALTGLLGRCRAG